MSDVPMLVLKEDLKAREKEVRVLLKRNVKLRKALEQIRTLLDEVL